MVCGASGIGKSSFIEHLVYTLSKEDYAKFQVRKVQKAGDQKQAFPFKQNQTKRCNTFPVNTTDVQIQLIDSPGYG